MKKAVLALAFISFSSTAAANEGLPLWLAGIIAWAQHHAALARIDRHDRR